MTDGVRIVYDIRMNVKDSVLDKLLSCGRASGAQLSRELGVSRNAVWKAVCALREAGYEIASDALGYSLISGNVISETALRGYMKKSGIDILIMPELPSTNDMAKTIAQKGRTVCVIAERQTVGRGRLGRGFVSPAGCGIYFSVVVRPDLPLDKAQLITAYAAVAVARSVSRQSGAETKIKWVNDVFMCGKKICGILTEAAVSIEGNCLDYAVIGIGINVLKSAELPDVATSIEEASGRKLDRNGLIAAVLDELSDIELGMKSGEFMSEYRIMSNIIDKEVIVNGDYIAIARGIDDDGAVILETADGLKKLNGGEVSLKLK